MSLRERPLADPAEAVLDVEGISVWLSGREVLHDVSFSIRPGEFTGLIGSNGAGKTTILRVILGLQATSTGRVLVAGGRRSRRNPLIGYVPQKVLFDPDVPVGPVTSWRSASTDIGSASRCRSPAPGSARRGDARRGRRDALRRPARRQPLRWRAAAGAHRPRPDQPTAAAPPRRAARQPRHHERAGGRRAPRADRHASSASPCCSRPTT